MGFGVAFGVGSFNASLPPCACALGSAAAPHPQPPRPPRPSQAPVQAQPPCSQPPPPSSRRCACALRQALRAAPPRLRFAACASSIRPVPPTQPGAASASARDCAAASRARLSAPASSPSSAHTALRRSSSPTWKQQRSSSPHRARPGGPHVMSAPAPPAPPRLRSISAAHAISPPFWRCRNYAAAAPARSLRCRRTPKSQRLQQRRTPGPLRRAMPCDASHLKLALQLLLPLLTSSSSYLPWLTQS